MARRTPTIANASALLALSQRMNNQQLPQQLSQEYAQQLQQANAANDYRYQQGLGELAGLRGRSMADVANVGAQQAADINQQFGQRLASANQDLSRRGLMGSTITSSNARTLGEGQASAQNRLAEQMSLLRQGTDASTTGNLVNFIQARTDQAPEMNSLMQLQQGLGAAGYTHDGPGSGGAGMAGMAGLAGGPTGGLPLARSLYGHTGPGSGGAGGGGIRPGGVPLPPMGHDGPGSGGAGGGIVGTGYPTLSNGVVQNPWFTPVAGLNQGQASPMQGLRRQTADLSAQLGRNDPYALLLQAMQGGNGGGGGSSQAAPMIRTAGDINNSRFDANGRLTSTPRNPAFYGTNAPAYTITMPGSFQGFRGSAPQLPSLNMAPRGFTYTPRSRPQNPMTEQQTPSTGGRPGMWQSSSGQWHRN